MKSLTASTSMGSRVGHEDTVWAKFLTMAEGARIASEELWP